MSSLELGTEAEPEPAVVITPVKRKQECEPCSPGAPLWMATFSDMATLLMAFFVLMLQMTDPDLRTLQRISGALSLAFGVDTINLDLNIPSARSMMINDFSPNESRRDLLPDVRQKMETQGRLLIRNTELFDNQFDIEREFLILQAALESEIEKGEVNVRIEDELLVVEVPLVQSNAGTGSNQLDGNAGVVSEQLITTSAKVAQIQSEITRDINVVATQNSSLESSENSTAELLNKLQYFREDLQTEIAQERLEVEMRDDSLYIKVDGDDSFTPGSAELRPNFITLLGEIGRSLVGVATGIAIEGHTDSTPIAFRDKFQSNWDLSAARASSVAAMLMVQQGLADIDYEVLGFADTVPIASNETAIGRAQNRRIEIKMTGFVN